MKQLIMRGVLLMAGCSATDSKSRPSVGAIRWDAWTGGRVTEEVERSLGPAKYHPRLPWFAEIRDRNAVRIDGSPQRIMDREIAFAAKAGLDYWAFLVYPEESPMSTALKQYLQSTERKRIRFCLIMHGTLNAKEEAWLRERDRGGDGEPDTGRLDAVRKILKPGERP